MFKPFVTNIILVLPTTDLPRVNPQCQFMRQSQVTVLNPTLFAGPKELWILPVKPVHSDAPAKHTIQFFFKYPKFQNSVLGGSLTFPLFHQRHLSGWKMDGWMEIKLISFRVSTSIVQGPYFLGLGLCFILPCNLSIEGMSLLL